MLSGYSFGLSDEPKATKVSQSQIDLILQHDKIGEKRSVAANCACLFTFSSLVLFGNKTGASNFRQKIRNDMTKLGIIQEQSFVRERQFPNTDDYLEANAMK